MSKAYSNRALPAGTVLREWRLEEVLGVGGFGIVYKGRGIYFNELVAIKEYFPSSISERGEDDTVVPIDSDAEEVHALGLKKFVEEAKLLWNLSTPTRHPNIVSVRSLFEIHGTAYMVMDFEDGNSLSRLLKKGRRFNESSLRSMILPIAEGLERAHRVGVLHRDIKPPNIIINDDGRSVLIDFGSARFESGDATSTKVTFHTPPYAAIEQYVRTFPQGPWTDIYALGVVLYECITGEKPAEVLERMHGDAGTPLADGNWPGFSRSFLHAVDQAMVVRPEDRPQSISEWIAMLDMDEDEGADDDDEDDTATRIGSWDTTTPSIVPIAPTRGGSAKAGKIETGVPDTPSKAEFSRRSDEAESKPDPAPVSEAEPRAARNAKQEGKGKSKLTGKEALTPDQTEEPVAAKQAPAAKDANPGDKASAPSSSKVEPAAKATDGKKPAGKGELPTKAIAGGVAGLALIAVVGWSLSGSDSESANSSLDSVEAANSVPGDAASRIASATMSDLVKQARDAGMPQDLVSLLQPIAGGGGGARGGSTSATMGTLAGFATASLAKAKSLVAALPLPAQRNSRSLRNGLAALERNAGAISASETPEDAAASTRELIGLYGKLRSDVEIARLSAKPVDTLAIETEIAPAAGSSAQGIVQSAETPAASGGGVVTDRHRRDFATALSGARSVARQVIRLGDRDRPGSNASEQEKQDFRVRQAAASAARDYDKYLDGLEASMRGNITGADADQSIAKANQTRGYLSDLLKRSQLTLQ